MMELQIGSLILEYHIALITLQDGNSFKHMKRQLNRMHYGLRLMVSILMTGCVH